MPSGNLLLWVQLPDGASGDALFEAALQRGIKLSPGSMFTTSRRYEGCVRLSCGRVPDAELDAAIRTLGSLI